MSEDPLADISAHVEMSSTVSFLSCSVEDYNHAAPPYNNIRMQALIFTPLNQPRRLLLIQQNKSPDPNAFSDLWTVPAAQPSRRQDSTLFHTLTRAVYEQTNLHLSRVNAMVGSELVDQVHPYMKVYFTVEVQELQTPDLLEALEVQRASETTDQPAELLNHLPIVLDKESYFQYIWIDKTELEVYVSTGLFPDWAKTSYEIMLQAFDPADIVDSSTSTSATPEDQASQVSSPSAAQSSTDETSESKSPPETQAAASSPRRKRGPNRRPSYSNFISKFSIKDKK